MRRMRRIGSTEWDMAKRSKQRDEQAQRDEPAMRGARFDFMARRVIGTLRTQIIEVRAKLKTFNVKEVPAGVDPTEFAKEKVRVMRQQSALMEDFILWTDTFRTPALAAENRDRLLESGNRALKVGPPYDPLSVVIEGTQAFASTFPTPAEYQRFYMQEVVPALNALGSTLRRCAVCGLPYPQTRRDRTWCSPACGSTFRMRGRPRTRASAAADEISRTAARTTLRIEKHFKTCKACKSGRPCLERETLLNTITAADDAFTRKRLGLQVDAAADQLLEGEPFDGSENP
ncbi:MAG: hypothetical protein AMXMBFR34_28870 [Myxococcaceae bacterium]